LKDETGNPRWVNQVYLRLKVTNTGNTFAKDATVYVNGISYTPRSGGKIEFRAEVLDLKLALTFDRTVFNLAKVGRRVTPTNTVADLECAR
jgi:hypothetical protein